MSSPTSKDFDAFLTDVFRELWLNFDKQNMIKLTAQAKSRITGEHQRLKQEAVDNALDYLRGNPKLLKSMLNHDEVKQGYKLAETKQKGTL